jgi:hypothetical protein
MTERRTFILINPVVRSNALQAVRDASPMSLVSVMPGKRSNEQSAKFHALCTDLAKSPVQWFGKRRTQDEWKILMISGHSVATKHPGDVIPGLEGEMVAIRESSASMGVARASSLIEYTVAFCVMSGVELHETESGGWLDA